MSQALHIFRKDLRSLRWEIGVAMALVIAHTLARSRSGEFPIVDWLLPPAWIYLVVRAILEEPLPGDRQFWITRPYSRKSLVGAKALFVLALVNLPLLISDCAILAAYGFAPVNYGAGLLWRQAALAVVVLLPAAALAAVTRNLSQILLVLFATAAGLIIVTSLKQDSWGPMEWIRYVPVVALWLAAALLVLVWQYAGRKTVPSRMILLAAVALTPAIYAALPWSAAFGAHARMLPQSAAPALAIRLDPSRSVMWGPPIGGRPELARASVPLEISGLGPGQDFQSDAVSVQLESQGETWRYHWSDAMAVVRGSGGNFWADIYVSGPWRAVRRQHVRLRVAIALTVFAANAPIAPEAGTSWFAVSNFGKCKLASDTFRVRSLECVSPLRPPPRTVTNAQPLIHLASYAPYPAEFRLDPIVSVGFERRIPWSERIRFVTERPIAHLVREVEVADVRLGE